MNIEQSEFLRNQMLLLQLAQLLIPLSEQVVQKVPTLSRHLFVPPLATEENSLRNSSLTLKVLSKIEGDVRKFIDSIGSKTSICSNDEAPEALVRPKEGKNKQPALDSKTSDENRILIDKVLVAIQALTSIPVLEHNKGFRDILKKLKPTLDSLIETVGKSEMPSSSGNRAFRSQKRANALLPSKPPQTNKNIQFPHKEIRESETGQKAKPHTTIQVLPSKSGKTANSESNFDLFSFVKSTLDTQKKRGKNSSARAEEKQYPPIKLKEFLEKSTPVSPRKIAPRTATNKEATVEAEPQSRPNQRLDKTTLTSFPFPPQPFPATKPLKKKRKTFWFREEEEEGEEEDRNHRS